MRVAHLFCEMLYRLRVVGLTEDNSYDFAISQTELAEALGFTTVHTGQGGKKRT